MQPSKAVGSACGLSLVLGEGALLWQVVCCGGVQDLYCQAEELWEEVSRLRSIREEVIEIDRIFSETQQLEKPPLLAALEKLAMSTPNIKVSAASGEWKGWELVISGTKRKAPTSPKISQLQIRFTALEGASCAFKKRTCPT